MAKTLRVKERYPAALPWLRGEVEGTAQAEFRFHKDRRWRFDYACPKHRLAIEVEGAVWTGGRHTRGSGFVKDMEKYNAAAILGWRLLRFTPTQMRTGEFRKTVRDFLENAGKVAENSTDNEGDHWIGKEADDELGGLHGYIS